VCWVYLLVFMLHVFLRPFLYMARSRLMVCWWYTCCQATEPCSPHCSGSRTELPCGLRSDE
jgi:hypothetical protein